ncbi:NepR family anti-sigma factor [Pelagovum pacificum]|nr:NepR family anti-sigma factor [Pelagovum pacificum]
MEDIDAHLKRAFSEIENEAVPDKLLNLLEELRQQDRAPASERVNASANAEDDE